MMNPTLAKYNPQLGHRQQGVVLFIMLMLLIIMSLMVAWSVKTVTFETKISANQAFKDQAFNRAEAAVITMENCITGATAVTASTCKTSGNDLTANTVFTGVVPGFLERNLNFTRSASGYWSGFFTNNAGNPLPHNWNITSQFTTVNTAGLSSTQQPRVTVERQNQVDMAGFSRDSASQGFDLGFATPFRVTANSADAGAVSVGARAIVQAVVFVPTAAISTPE